MDFGQCSSNLMGSVNSAQDNIDKKQENYNLAEAEYARYCSQLDASLQELQGAKAEFFENESILRSLKYRSEQYDVSINRAYAVSNEIQEKSEKVDIELEKETQLLLQNDEEFNNFLTYVTEKMGNDRQMNDRTQVYNKTEEISIKNEAVIQELQDIRNFLSDFKQQSPLIPDTETNSISLNLTKTMSVLGKELEELQSKITSLKLKGKQLKASISLLKS